MKKILLATSILAGTAGFAAAEITLSGDARMGILNDFVLDPASSDKTGFTSRFRVAFTATGASDNGLEFGAFTRLHEGGAAEQGTKGHVWVSGAFGKISMGDVDSAALVATGGDINGVGLTGLGDLNEMSFLGQEAVEFWGNLFWAETAPNSAVLYEYAANGFGFYLSASNPNFTYTERNSVTAWEGKAYAAGVSWAADGYKLGLGYEKLEAASTLNSVEKLDVHQWVVGADAELGQLLVQARYFDGGFKENEGATYDADTKQYSLGATWTADALAVTAFLSRNEMKGTDGMVYATERTDAWGLGASYDLGGGASVVGGIVRQKEDFSYNPTVKDTAFDLGLSFTF